MNHHPSFKMLLATICFSFALFLLIMTGCVKTPVRQLNNKTAQPSKTWVIYPEGYGGTNQYDLPNKSRLIKVSMDGSKREVLGDFKGQIDDVALSPISGRLAFTAEGTLKVMDLRSKKVVSDIAHKSKTTFIDAKGTKTESFTCSCVNEEIHSPVWSPDGTTLAYIRKHYGLGFNWATLDTLDVKTMYSSQAAQDDGNFVKALLKAWVPGTNSVIVDISENRVDCYRPQHLGVLDLGSYKVKDIVDNTRFVGFWKGPTLLCYDIIPQEYQEKMPSGERSGIRFNARNLGGITVPNSKEVVGPLNHYIKEPVAMAIANAGDVFYADTYVSGTTFRTYRTYRQGKATYHKIPIMDYSRFWRISPLGKRTLVAKEKDYYIRDMWCSQDGRYLAFYRTPFAAAESTGPWRELVQLAVCDTKTAKVKVLADAADGRIGVNRGGPFPTGVSLATYTEH